MKRPNILFIFSDQHRPHAMSCYGDPNIETVNLDRLAAEGIRFTNAYSNTPLCSPFRACLYTGQYFTTHGVNCLFKPLLPVQPVLAEVLHAAGYYTSHMGKWHLTGGDCPSHFVSPYFRPGWDEWLGWDNSNEPFDTKYSVGAMPKPYLTLPGYQTDAVTDLTVAWLRNYDGDRPFFHVMSVEPPHSPNEAPDKYMAMYRDRELVYHPNFDHECENAEAYRTRLRGYYAQIKNLDDNVGCVLSALEETGRLDDTVVFYFSDHGDLMGSHGLGQKSHAEEESSRIPLIIRWPARIPSGAVTDGFISAVDLMPSLLGLLDIPIPETVEGADLSGLWTGRTDRGTETVLIQFDRNYFDYTVDHRRRFRAIRYRHWKYSVHFTCGPDMLYNLAEDPYEMNNLVGKEACRGVQEELHGRLVARLEEIGDPFMQEGESHIRHGIDRTS